MWTLFLHNVGKLSPHLKQRLVLHPQAVEETLPQLEQLVRSERTWADESDTTVTLQLATHNDKRNACRETQAHSTDPSVVVRYSFPSR